MKKILVRSGMSPLDTFSADEIIKRNSIGNNVGNLIYAYSIFRNLTTDDVELVSDYYGQNPNNADMINEKYDAYVFPLANAIRKSFIPTLNRYTALIEKLTIPVYVIGLGMQFSYEPNISERRSYDGDVKRFVKAVLEKSNMLGLRGQITSDYLSHLGFKEGRDHQVIGCPSMYTFGNNIKIRELKLNDSSSISVNMTPTADQRVLKFLNDLSPKYNNLNFVPQDMDELLLTYAGAPLLGPSVNSELENYPNSLHSHIFKNGKVKYFLNAPTWIEYMKTIDLSIGTRLHGNVVATLAGTPSITIPIDARMRELSEYHNFPRVTEEEISENTHLEELVEKVDFHSVEKSHQKNYDNFISFLAKNGIDHIYDKNAEGVKHPLEVQLESIQLQQPIGPITACPLDEMRKRLEKGYQLMLTKAEKTNKNFTKKIHEKNIMISSLKNDVRRLNAKIKNIENSRSWKITKPLRSFTTKISRPDS
ncbi:polysaccharide pyruvyl transferase family protein [Heyndrickxia sporothermodurans]|uniref:polysaccharide pyruvyl transferase family protein n=3 Tax=Heyndrickxia sporothermodurans TaxID=46224 RepID=UPI002E248D4B|nr:polysaccharide pyruvyl transferase family protein [Heyndrickxia sporothermodurans]MED3656197.1 polysaccharide pyruvyl transferase family protein [Heyndrickxia sporothermodurans]MED3697647.1 polysaccharide pyruvyl transferase family protein [Heyndrickxia sporothermodurans]